MIGCAPSLNTFQRSPVDKRVEGVAGGPDKQILGSEGLWASMSADDAVQLVATHESARSASAELASEARRRTERALPVGPDSGGEGASRDEAEEASIIVVMFRPALVPAVAIGKAPPQTAGLTLRAPVVIPLNAGLRAPTAARTGESPPGAAGGACDGGEVALSKAERFIQERLLQLRAAPDRHDVPSNLATDLAVPLAASFEVPTLPH
jgi:hypothetical protein